MRFSPTAAVLLLVYPVVATAKSDNEETSQYPALVSVGSRDDFGNEQYYPLPECWGDCVDDGDCQEGLVCCQRLTLDDPVVGCEGSGWENNNFDFCLQPQYCSTHSTVLPTTSATAAPTVAATTTGTVATTVESTTSSKTDTVDDSSGNDSTTNEGGGVYETPIWSDPNDPWQFLPFCKIPQGQEDYIINNCKADVKNEEWAKVKYGAKENGVNITYYDRPLQGECGPHCRPSCITLMLDLDDFDHENDLTCNANELCHCSHNKLFECGNDRLENLFEEHPKCFLENADCLGPTIFDDVVAHAEWQDQEIADLALQHCKNIPDDDLFCRFQEWSVVTPIERYSCEDGEYPHCLNRERRIYWEFCNIVEEDPFCDVDENCQNGNRCGQQCEKKTEPFPNGWTTFTVTAPIPLDPLDATGSSAPDSNYVCNQRLPLAADTKTACFMQRIELYYPPDDEDCGTGCPNCHECPLISLGDKFGPLQVVGFGHCIQRINEGQTCNSCDSAASKRCEKGCELDCDDLFEWGCEESVDCHTAEEIGFLNFEENMCSWRLDKVPEGYVSDSPVVSESNQAIANGGDDDRNTGLVMVFPLVLGLVLVCCCCCFCARWLWTRSSSGEGKDRDGVVKGDNEDQSQPSDTDTLPVSQLGEPSASPLPPNTISTTLAFYNNHDRSGIEGDEISVVSNNKNGRQLPSKKTPKRHVDWTGDQAQ